MVDATPRFAPGTRLGDGGRYELRRRIGIGGMAEVYKAVDTRLADRVVAIKTLLASVASHACGDRIRRLFIQEAQALSRVKDENVVDVLDFGVVTDSETPYMVMEFLQGEDLGAFLKRTKQVNIADAVDVILGVCAGVHACHLAGIIHRDLKPANIFLAATLKGRQPKVLDFSVAKVLGPENDRAERTRTDLIVGTPSYMSPEQALGQPANELSDQYSIGALLYRSLTGRPPRGAEPKPRELRPDIPLDLEATILRAIDPTPANRFGTVHELGQHLLAHTSPAGRDRWKTYYEAPPTPLAPNLTGSIAVGQDSGQGEQTRTVTTAAKPYDFGLHERTTRVEAASARGLDETTGSKSPDPTIPAIESATDAAPGTVAVLVPPQAPVPELAAPGGTTRAASVRSAAAPSYRAPARGKLVVAFVSAAVVVVAITGIGAVHLRGRAGVPERPAVPKILNSPAPTPGAHSAISPAPPHTTPPISGTTVETATPVAQSMPKPPVNRTRASRPHRPSHAGSPKTTSNDDAPVRYGADGMPILN